MSEAFSNRPYKGADSFQAEDASLFFGRELAAEDVVTRILSSRCTLLHARSGTGKTSLINAPGHPQAGATRLQPESRNSAKRPVDGCARRRHSAFVAAGGARGRSAACRSRGAAARILLLRPWTIFSFDTTACTSSDPKKRQPHPSSAMDTVTSPDTRQ